MSHAREDSLRFLKSEDQLVEAVHAYVSAWAPASLACLPLPVRASEIHTGDDITRIAVGIAQLRLDPRLPQDVLDVLEQLHPYFSAASIRLSQVQTHAAESRQPPREAMRKLFG